jgi:hypothetical protein
LPRSIKCAKISSECKKAEECRVISSKLIK